MRELAEETGYRAREWARAGMLHNAIAYSTEGIEIWFARGLQAGERRWTSASSRARADAPRRSSTRGRGGGKLTDAKTLIGCCGCRSGAAAPGPCTGHARLEARVVIIGLS